MEGGTLMWPCVMERGLEIAVESYCYCRKVHKRGNECLPFGCSIIGEVGLDQRM